MIAVVADDFTGAAETAGIAFRHGLVAEVQTGGRPSSGADLVVIDTHTRSSPRADAERAVAEAVGRLREAGVDWVYKKVDSVLRGHVVAELARAVEGLGGERALLVPANPTYGQTIREGRYAIDERPLADTPFAADPEFPAGSSDVLDLLGAGDGVAVTWSADPDRISPTGIAVAAAEDVEGLEALARRVDGRTLAAGGAEFFAAVLRVRLGLRDGAPDSAPEPAPRTVVFVLGSGSERSRAMLERARAEGIPLVGLPASPGTAEDPASRLRAAVDALKARGRVILALDPAHGGPGAEVRDLPRRLGDFARGLAERAPEPGVHWFVDGGSTASTVVRALGWERFGVERVEGRGVVTLGVVDGRGRRVTVKPGNYPWPDRVMEWLR